MSTAGENAQTPIAKQGSLRSCLREIFRTRVWVLFLSRAVLLAAVFVVVPHLQTELTEYFKHKHTDEDIKCTGHHHKDRDEDDEQPEPCKQAHTDVMIWTTGRTIFSAFAVSLFLHPAVGTWSDMFGRKRFLLASYLMHLIPLAALALYLRAGLELYWYYPAYVLSLAIGAQSLLLAYVADVVSEENRILAFGLLSLMFSFGVIGGTSLTKSGMVPDFEAAVYASSMLTLAGALLLMFFVPESLSTELQHKARIVAAEKREKSKCSRSLAFCWTSFVESMKILWRTPLFQKLTTIMFIVALVAEEYIEFKTQYLQEVLNFGTSEQATMMMIMGITGLLVNTVGLWLAKPVLKLSDKQLLIVGLLGMLFSFILLAVASAAWMAYLATALISLWTMLSVAISSMKSTNVEPEEQGAVQGALTAISSVGFGLGPLLFLALFVAFRHGAIYLPGAPFYFASLLLAIAVGVALRVQAPNNTPPSAILAEKPNESELEPLLDTKE